MCQNQDYVQQWFILYYKKYFVPHSTPGLVHLTLVVWAVLYVYLWVCACGCMCRYMRVHGCVGMCIWCQHCMRIQPAFELITVLTYEREQLIAVKWLNVVLVFDTPFTQILIWLAQFSMHWWLHINSIKIAQYKFWEEHEIYFSSNAEICMVRTPGSVS
jgi:hypothetical protein